MNIAEETRFKVFGKEVLTVGVKERILTIRLMEKLNANPAYAEVLGISVVNSPAEPEKQTVSNSAGNQS